MNEHESFPHPWTDGYVSYIRLDTPQMQLRIKTPQRLEAEIAQHLRNQTIINDIKRQCGVSTSEGK